MKMRRILAALLLLIAGFAAGIGSMLLRGPDEGHTGVTSAAVRYQCPMHPQYTSDKPGTCPICGMTLVPIQTGTGTPAPATVSEPAGATGPTRPPGTVHISADKQQLIGVTYGIVESSSASARLRAVGTVAVDETRIVKVHPRVEGWIDRVYADFMGKLVGRGQPLLTVYSPELLAAQQEFLLALRNRDRLRESPLTSIVEQNERLAAAARERLLLSDMSASLIDQIAQTGEPVTNVALYAPADGYVIARNAYPKQRVTPDTELFALADLSRVWILAEVSERDASSIRIGMPARVTVSSSGRTLTGRVSYVQPQLEVMSRTLKARIEVSNPRLSLKPDMFVEVELEMTGPERLTVPLSALLDSGLRKVVFVDRGGGYLEPRQVETGEYLADRVEILSGLARGERVVTSGNFLIDSESQLKAAAAGQPGHAHGTPPEAAAPPATPGAAGAGGAGGHRHD